ncbi:hypothetical protein [Candidatus Spongiihabitans sp.]|uniref:hypothetical protein n=1 Tax=Candidatus Spongiihabitans sp. TaxID=3101308 RepID=UPI003C79B06C
MSEEEFNINDDIKILEINSPKNMVGGPYAVVYKNIEERWAIVAMGWGCDPVLGIRWFWDKKGHPISTGHPVWFVVPSHLNHSILAGLPLKHKFRNQIDKFLVGDIKGSGLKK